MWGVGQTPIHRNIYSSTPFSTLRRGTVIDNIVRVAATPGCTLDRASVVVARTSLMGLDSVTTVLAVAGDLFEKEEDLQDDSI